MLQRAAVQLLLKQKFYDSDEAHHSVSTDNLLRTSAAASSLEVKQRI
jgi:hypothetical protein